MSKIDFTGRVAIVTGAGAGLGKNHAIELAKRGAKVVVNDLGGARDGTGAGSAAADEVVSEIKALGGEAVPNYDNVATVEGGENITKTAIDAFGKVDIVVNNAGILRDKSFTKLEESNWDAVLAVHLKGAYCVTKPAFINMRENGYGRIIMTTSAAGLFGNFGQANYSSAKMGLVGMANTLKLEGGKYNIKVNVLAPLAGTRLTEDIMPPNLLDKLKVEYVTPVVLWMCSEEFTESGVIMNAGAGYFSRSAMLTGPGMILHEGKQVPTPEDIKDNWDKINSLDNAQYNNDANGVFSALGPLLQ
ncbi:MAG: SDR family oxidoreductase [Spirochaetota bacterium]|nr:SDR family oxidoreductase [Spirochaetota bacterium]